LSAPASRATIILGAAFLGIKFNEYSEKWHDHLVPGFNFNPSAAQLNGTQAGSVEIFFASISS
jgi:hypothetical protein